MSIYSTLRAAAERRLGQLPPARRLRIELVAAELAHVAGGRGLAVLDAGCEVGLLSLRLARRHPSWQVRAIDIDERALSIARHRAQEQGVKNVSFARLDITTDEIDGRFDAVTAVECLAEIPDDDAAIAFMAGSLRSGGVLLVHVPERSWRPVLRGSRSAWKGEKRHGYGRDEIAAKLEAAGLEVASVRPTTHAAVHLVEELRERLKQRSLKAQLPLYPLAVLVVALERAGWRPGTPRALLAVARRPPN